jgi:hypothetical protein
MFGKNHSDFDSARMLKQCAADILLPATVGTSVMTLFSYLMSELANEDFSEPRHLSVMLKRLVPGLPKKSEHLVGWSAHYTVGSLFATFYVWLWKRKQVRPTLKTALLIGALSSVIAVLIWRATFKVHPLPPRINYRKFYLQLVPAHIIFALIVTMSYRLQIIEKDQILQ